MAFQLISKTPEDLLAAFQSAVAPLLYMSETDAPVDVHAISVADAGESFLADDIKRIFYGPQAQFKSAGFEWAEANRLESNGTQRFFRDLADIITTYPNNEYLVQEDYHRTMRRSGVICAIWCSTTWYSNAGSALTLPRRMMHGQIFI